MLKYINININMKIEVNNCTPTFQYAYDNKIFDFDLFNIVTDNDFFTYEDIFIDKCLGKNIKCDIPMTITDNIFEILYYFTHYFIIENNILFLINIKCKKNKTIIYFDTFTYPKISYNIYILHKIGNEKFILDLQNKEYFYVTNHHDDDINILLNKLNNCTNIKRNDTQGHGYKYFALQNEIKHYLFETYCDINNCLRCEKVHIY